MTIEPAFTFKYAQPPEYHFCQDSVLFARFVAEELLRREVKIDSRFRALDLCAGCGVIGFEIAHHLPEISKFDFIEIQAEFKSYFEENLQRSGQSAQQFHFRNENLSCLLAPENECSYELIVANPPFFMLDEGRLSPDGMRNRARFFTDGEFTTFAAAVAHALKPLGHAYFLMKSGERHGRVALRDLRLALAERLPEVYLNLKITESRDLRGTQIIHITK